MKKLLITLALIPMISQAQNCSKITEDLDKFTNVTSYITNTGTALDFFKTIKGRDTIYTLYIEITTVTATAGKKGAFVLLSNGKKIERPMSDVECNAMGGSLVHSSTIKLTRQEMEMLKRYAVTDAKLYVYTLEISEIDQLSIKDYANCISRKDPIPSMKAIMESEEFKAEPVKILNTGR